MPRENPVTKSPNPAFRFFEWKGGEFTYYDKETKQSVKVGKKFSFILLAEMATVKGYNERLATGIYSNEVADIQTEPLTVKYFKGNEVIVAGLWGAVKERVTSKNVGGHYALSLYIAVKDAGHYRIANLTVQGAALGAWIEFRKAAGKDIYSKGVRVAESKTGKHGSVTYEFPVFAITEVSPESDDAAGVLQKQVKQYHADYRKSNKAVVPDVADIAGDPDDEPSYEEREAAVLTRSQRSDNDGAIDDEPL